MLGAVLSFAVMAVAVRELLRHMGSFEILFLRSLVMLALACAMVSRARRGGAAHAPLRPHVPQLLHLLGQFLWVYAIGALPLATVFAIEFTMPVWAAVLAVLFLRRAVEPLRAWCMLVLGLAGVLLILRPGFGAVPAGGAGDAARSPSLYASNMIATKRLSATDSALAILFCMSVIQLPLALVPALPQWVSPRLPTCPG